MLEAIAQHAYAYTQRVRAREHTAVTHCLHDALDGGGRTPTMCAHTLTHARMMHPPCRYPHLKKQGRCELYKREPPEGEEDTFEPTEEEQEEGPEALSAVEGDVPITGGAPAWSSLVSSSSEAVKYQVGYQHPLAHTHMGTSTQSDTYSNALTQTTLKLSIHTLVAATQSSST